MTLVTTEFRCIDVSLRIYQFHCKQKVHLQVMAKYIDTRTRLMVRSIRYLSSVAIWAPTVRVQLLYILNRKKALLLR